MMRRIVGVWVIVAMSGVLSAAEPVKPDMSGVSLGSWYCAGPFKDQLFGLHLKSFETVFPPEKQVIAAGGKLADLSATWTVEKLPGMTSAVRRWIKFADWTDGYVNQLPVGPPPMRNETCYLYRTITAKSATSVEMRMLAADNIKAWLNGKQVGGVGNPHRSGASRFPAGLNATLELAAGANRLLIKITSMHGRHGFAFSIPSLTPSNDTPPGRLTKLYDLGPGDEPYASGAKLVKPRTSSPENAKARVKAFRFDITPIPMYDPARLKMVEDLDRTAPSTSGGSAYLKALAELKPKITGDPVAAAGRIEEMWRKQIRQLGPIAFVRCPPYAVNAIAPYIARGAGPAAICVFDPSNEKTPVRVIHESPGLCIFDMNLSYDARTIFFAARNGGQPWHIYEIGVDGTRLKQITKGDSSNISPVQLPSGEIMFVSTRAGTRVVCQKQPSGLLYVCNRDGSNVRRVSGNTLSDHTPQVMNDGRVLFTRWDYGVDKNVFCRQNLWTMNPDGTRFALFGSNTKEDPNGFWEASAIPGRPEVVCVFGPHHSYHAGMIGLVWDRPVGHQKDIRGEGFRWITREMPAIGDSTLAWGYQDPCPVNERLFLVSWGGDGPRKNRIYLLDDRGNRKCVYESAGKKTGCWDPLLLRPRKTPPVIPNQSTPVKWAHRTPAEANLNPNDSLTGTFLLQDVYEGLGPTVKRGEVKSLAIVEQVPKYGDPAGAQIWGYSPTISRGTMFVRRIIGTVPVESDGSAHFKAPAIRDISFNALDAEGRLIRHMGSTLHIMPGETQSCLGCHETRGKVPARGPSAVIAAKRPPSVPKYPSWTEKGILDFTKVVQPVLDKHCIKCHSGPTPKKGVDLSGDKTHSHSMAYDQLLDRGMVHYVPVAGTGHENSSPKSRGSYVSKIRKHIETDFCVAKPLPLEDRKRIYTWIDANVPYFGTYEFTNSRVMGGRSRWYVTDKRKWFRRDFEPVFNKRCLPCHKRYITPQTYNYNPRGKGQILVTSRLWNDIALSSFQLGHGRISMIGQIGPVHRINLTHPEWSQMLTAPLAKSAGGMQLCKSADGGAVFKDKTDPDYQAMLKALKKGRDTLMADPRIDMPEALKKENLEKARADVVSDDAWRTRKDGWISKNATYAASSIIRRWTTDKEKLLNGKPYSNDWAFCTENESNPYIIITLDKAYAIDEVHVVNRVGSCQEFARTLTMWISSDQKTWTKTWSAGGRAQAEWHVKLTKTPKARYVKLGLTEKQYLDLKYVFVYGK
ncbi:MAG: discoidin domain-containing protein [Phycisphaerae bacterium]|jgi:hypothetical protein|nr:discoidin domain-containing protein [Phycisphaerae bacterium]